MSIDGLDRAFRFAISNFWLEWWWLVMAAGAFLLFFFGHFESRILLWYENRRLATLFKQLENETDKDDKWHKLSQLTPMSFHEVEAMRFRESIRICIAILAVIAFLLAAILQQIMYRF